MTSKQELAIAFLKKKKNKAHPYDAEYYDMAIAALEMKYCENAVSRGCHCGADAQKKRHTKKKQMTKWHTIRGFDKSLSYETNKEAGVDLPDCDEDVLVIYPEISIKHVHVKKSFETGMTGTKYYNGTMWAYFDRPERLLV